jgi:hypothetical protein
MAQREPSNREDLTNLDYDIAEEEELHLSVVVLVGIR